MNHKLGSIEQKVWDVLKKYNNISIMAIAYCIARSKSGFTSTYNSVYRAVKSLEKKEYVITTVYKRNELTWAKKPAPEEYWYQYYNKYHKKPPTRVVIVSIKPPTPEEIAKENERLLKIT